MSELAIKQAPAINNMDDLARVADMLSKSGYFEDARSAAQCGVKVLAGAELGIPAFSAMAGIHIVKGKPTLSANLMAAKVKGSGKYDYRVKDMTDEVCTIAFYQNGDEIGVSTFTKADAARAGTQNMGKFPRNMLFARAMSNGVRWFTPDVFLTTVYTPDELGAQVDEEGNVVDAEVKPVEEPKQEPVKAKVEEAPKPKTITPERAEALKKELTKLGYDVSNEAQLLEDAFGLSDLEHLIELTDGEAVILWQKLKKKAQEAAKEPWEKWADDSAAQAYGAQSGAFGSGAQLMTAWEALKESVTDVDGKEHNLYRAWFNDIQAALKQEKQAA